MQKLRNVALYLLVAVLLVAAFPISAQAASEEDTIRREIVSDYQSILSATGKESLHGYCGLMTSWQLYLLGVNKYLITADGNRQYDTYCNMRYTSGGHKVRTYPADRYTLENALYAATDYGASNSYNLLVGFDWTNTEAGALYGHAVIIYAILNETVYFAESFDMPIGRPEGQVNALSIQRFAQYYGSWTKFEGLIEFGKKDVYYAYDHYSADFFGTSDQPVVIYSHPCNGTVDGLQIKEFRTVPAGERLHVTAMLKDDQGAYYYRVDSDGEDGYISANLLNNVGFRHYLPGITDLKLPERLDTGSRYYPEAKVTVDPQFATGVRAAVVDANNNQILSKDLQKKNDVYRLSSGTMNLSSLTDGVYKFRLIVTREQNYMQDGQLVSRPQEVTALNHVFCVGATTELPANASNALVLPDGWSYENGTWYFCKDGKPFVGWLCDEGIDYYLKEDGSITTGWVKIHEKYRYFTNTGAMRTGWMETPEGRYYLLRNGALVNGWREIDGVLHFFDASGLKVNNAWVEHGGYRYFVQKDGTPLTGGWQDTDQGRFYFHETGAILAQVVKEKDRTYIDVLATIE